MLKLSLTGFVAGLAVTLSPLLGLAADAPKPLVTGMKNPESVCLGEDGVIYVTEIGEFAKDGDGQVTAIKDGKTTPFAKGLNDPKGIVRLGKRLFLTDKNRVVQVDADGNVTTFVAPEKFPAAPQFLNDIEVDAKQGVLYVSDSGNLMGQGGVVYKIDIESGKVSVVVDAKSIPGLNTPNGLTLEGESHLLLVDFGSGNLYRINLADHAAEKIGEGFDGGDGLTWNKSRQLLVTSWKTGKVFGIAKLGQAAKVLSEKAFEQAADTCLDATGKFLLIPDMKAGTLTAFPATVE